MMKGNRLKQETFIKVSFVEPRYNYVISTHFLPGTPDREMPGSPACKTEELPESENGIGNIEIAR